MKRQFVLLFLLTIMVWACDDSVSDPQFSPDFPSPSLAVLEQPPSACYAVEPVSLLADETLPVGTITTGNDEENLYVVYETSSDWPLRKTALFVGDDTYGIPTNGSGNPQVGQFPYKSKHPDGRTRVVWEVSLAEAGISDGTAVVAAFAEVGPAEATEGAWAEGSPITQGRSWAMYYAYDLVDCGVEEVGAEGGEVTTLDGTVTLRIPPGALQEPVEITVEPIDVSEIGSAGPAPSAGGAALSAGSGDGTSTPSAAVASDGSLINGVLPIEGTAYRMGPDGLQFDQPVDVTLEYDPTKLPAGSDEGPLQIFIVNAFFDPRPTTVSGSNQLSTTTTHFSDFFIGIPTESDLILTELSAAPDPARYGEEFLLTVEGAVGPSGAPVSESEIAVGLSGVNFFMNSVPAGCVYDDASPINGVFYYRCDPGSLNPGGIAGPFEFLIEPYAVFGSEPATLTITAEFAPATASGVTDTDPSNNIQSLHLPVLPAVAADLRVSGLGFTPFIKKAGKEMTVTAIVESRPESPDPVDASINFSFEAGQAGIEILADLLPGGCTYASTPSGTSVTCPLGTMAPGDTKTTEIVTVPRQVGTRSMDVTVFPTASDLNPGNNTLGGSYTADPSVLDLAVTLDESFDPIQSGQTLVYSSTVESLASSTDPLPNGTLRIQALGDVQIVNVSDSCEDISSVIGLPAAVNCALPELAPGESTPAIDPFAMVVEALSPDQEIQAEAFLLLPDYVDDTDASNDSATETTRVLADVEADLQMVRFSVDPDPAKALLDLTYSVEVTNAFNSANDVSGATLELVILGSVETQNLPYFCSSSRFTFPAQTTVTCNLPDIPRGDTQFAFATVRPSGGMAGQNLDATATVIMPDGGVDTDETNNFRNLLTPVVAPEANLGLAPIQESADPINENETVTYSVQAFNSAGSDSPDAAPEGSVIQLRLTGGDATLVSASAACEDLSSGGIEPIILNCSFGPLGPGAVTPVFDVEVAPVGAPQTLEMSAEVRMPSPAIEVDPSDNSGVETTTVNPVVAATHAYVVNQNSDNVSVVDANTDQVVQTITVGANPFAAAITPDGSEVWVTHSTGWVDIIDTSDNTVTIGALAAGSSLFDVAFSPDGSTAYFSRTSSGAVAVVDVASRTLTTTITGLSFPRGLEVLPNGAKAYVAGNAAVFVLDLVNNTLAETIAVDGQTYFVAVAPDNSEVYVTQQPSSGAGLVRTIDTSTDALVGAGITVGFNPYAIEVNPSGTEAYVVDSSNRLDFVDLLGGSVITSAGVTSDASSRLALTADGASLFLSSYSDPGQLFEIDTSTRSVSATTDVGAYPVGLAVRQ